MTIKSSLILVFVISLQTCASMRRIIQGIPTPNEKRYMVYLVKSQEASVEYDAWLCGGVIVHPKFIITSAACIEDVKYIYAIAGYHKYVNGMEIYNNPCTNAVKKKLIMTCVPKIYDFAYQDVVKWGKVDIGVAQVESQYDFDDDSYLQHGCSYPPGKIPINFDSKYTDIGTSAFILGWGHNDSYRKIDDLTDYNQILLHETYVKIVSNTYCKKNMPTNFHPIIDKYMICTIGRGQFDSEGRTLAETTLLKEMCDCKDDSCVCSSKHDKVDVNEQGPGFCQNDHGGPIIGWVGGRAMLLGVMSVFVITKDYRCHSPYMYTSTSCTGAFLDCVIHQGALLGLDCKNLRRYGFELVQRRISWEGHPDGAAENEEISNWDTESSSSPNNSTIAVDIESTTTKQMNITRRDSDINVYRVRPQKPLHSWRE